MNNPDVDTLVTVGKVAAIGFLAWIGYEVFKISPTGGEFRSWRSSRRR